MWKPRTHFSLRSIQLHFTPDARESEVTLYHRLKLYEEDGTPSNLKKPVVHETYEDIVFSEPHEDFYNRVSKHVAGALAV